MRLFVAAELSDSVRAAAEKTSNTLQKALRRVGLDARWVSTDKMHLTIRFIGQVPDPEAVSLVDAVVAPLALPAFDVTLGGCGIFPPSGTPRVIWIGIADGLGPLAAIHDEMDRRLEPFGYEPERRPFSVHLTLARVKSAPRGSTAKVREILQAARVPAASCRITYATLFRSHLSPRGSRYERLREVAFTG